MLQGYSFSQQTVESFKDRDVFLETEDGEKISLLLQEILKGQMGLTQAIFKPSSLLKPNTKYFLKYSNQTESEDYEMKKWNSETKQMEKIYWQTSEIKNATSISSGLELNFEKTEVVHYGCGPSANAIFNIKSSNGIEIWYKTELIEVSTNTKTTFYLLERENKLNVGHGMCGGGFIFKNNGKYKVRFTPMNTDGEKGKVTDWEIFESPFTNDKGLRK